MSSWTWIALILIGAAAPPPGSGDEIVTDVRILELNGLDWRTAVDTGLDLVTRQGGAAIWTGRREVLPELMKLVQQDRGARCIQAPRMTSRPESPCTVAVENRRVYVAGLGRVADGPVNHASTVSFQPEMQAVPDGARLRVTCRPLDQGMLAKVALDDTWLLGMHSAAVRETARNRRGETPIRAEYQVPEVAACHVEGEWLIPKDGLLVMSLGVHTVQDRDGRARVRERVAVIESKPAAVASIPAQPGPVSEPLPEAPAAAALPGPALTWLVLPWSPVPPHALTVLPHPVGLPLDAAVRTATHQDLLPPEAPVSLPTSGMPAVPSRTLPQGITADGTPVLPSLPDEAVEPASDATSAEPRPSPQTPHPGRVPDGPAPGPAGSLVLGGPVQIRTGDRTLTADRLMLIGPRESVATPGASCDMGCCPEAVVQVAPVRGHGEFVLYLGPWLRLTVQIDRVPSATPTVIPPAPRDKQVTPTSTGEPEAPKPEKCPGTMTPDESHRMVVRLPKWRKSIELEIRDLPDATPDQP